MQFDLGLVIPEKTSLFELYSTEHLDAGFHRHDRTSFKLKAKRPHARSV